MESIAIFFVVLMIASGIVASIVNKYTKSVDQKRQSGNSNKSLEHTDCDTDNSCFHEYMPIEDDEYTKVCKNCGHRNSNKDKR